MTMEPGGRETSTSTPAGGVEIRTTDPNPADVSSREDVERLAREFEAAGRPFAAVSVVRREPPVSATVGDRALVTPTGELFGWIGGVACAQSVAVREATAAIERREPVLIGLAPDPETVDRPGLESFPMTCHSEGVLELFIDPVVPSTGLVVLGDSPIAHTLVRLATEVSLDVTLVTGRTAGTDSHSATVVGINDDGAVAAAVEHAGFLVAASMDDTDAFGIEIALDAGVPYVGLVASDERARHLVDTVVTRLNMDPADVEAAITQPAGLDIDAETPDEIAVSILAELIAARGDARFSANTRSPVMDVSSPDETAKDVVVDPVCGMDVVVGEEVASVTMRGETYRFCGQGCADAFEVEPDRFLDGGSDAD